MSKTATIKEEKILADFEKLSKKRKKEVADFVTYLKVKEELEATKEIIRDKDFLASIMRGDEDFRIRGHHIYLFFFAPLFEVSRRVPTNFPFFSQKHLIPKVARSSHVFSIS